MSDKLIANKLLAFLQCQLDVMDEVSVTQICTSNFTEDEIRSAKELLYTSFNMSDRMPSRRRDEKGARSLQDIINVLKVTDPDDVPTFVAKEQRSLPSVTFEHVDVTRLLKDITSLKASLADVMLKFEASQTTIADLRNEVKELRNTTSVFRSAEASNVNTKRGAFVCSPAANFASAISETSPSVIATARSNPVVPARSSVPAAPAPALAARVTVTSSSRRDYARAVSPLAAVQHQGAKTGNNKEEDVTPISTRSCVPDDDGFVKVQKKRRSQTCRNKCGTAPTGPNFLLKPAVPTTLLYVSRLHHSTTTQDLVEYIKVKATYIVRVEPLESRHSVNFKSFVARVPTKALETFTKEEFWPKGVVFRRFRGRLRDNGTNTDRQAQREVSS